MNKDSINGSRNETQPLPARLLSPQEGAGAAFKLEPRFLQTLMDRLQDERRKTNERQRRALSVGLFRTGPTHEAYRDETLPNQQNLEKLIEAAFWASLQREEGRSLTFVINYGPSLSDTDLLFHTPKPYTVKSLVKLAAAVGNQILGIGVAPDAQGKLFIWGISSFAPMSLNVLDPGQLIVKYVAANVAAITGDELLLLRSPHAVIFSSFWKKFAPTNQVSEFLAWSDPRVHAILTMLKAMRRFHHGGVLVVVPNDQRWRDSLGGTIPYEAKEPSLVLTDLVTRLSEMQSEGILQSEERRFTESYLETLAEAVAALTSVDGAVVVTYDLKIVGFGAKFKVSPVDSSTGPPRVLIDDPLEHRESPKWCTLDECDWGMRHQSAARFVFANHDAMAFVASQDGTVTVFGWEEWGDNIQSSSLVAHTRLELTVF